MSEKLRFLKNLSFLIFLFTIKNIDSHLCLKRNAIR